MTRTTTRASKLPQSTRATRERDRLLALCEETIARESRFWLREFHHALTLDDLKQEAREIVLKKVLPYFDPKRGAKVTTFATMIIRQHFRRLIRTTLLHGLLYSSTQRAAMASMTLWDERHFGWKTIAEGEHDPEPLTGEMGADPTEDYHRALLDEFTIRVLDSLDPEDRRLALALVLCKGEIRTLAAKLGQSHHVIRKRVHALRATIRQRLDE